MTVVDEPHAALYEAHEGIAVITLNRPQAMNAVNSALSTAVGEGLARAARSDDVRVVVITGAGRAFCAGADLKELAQGRPVHAPDRPEWGFAGLVRHWLDKPVIAAVNGFAMGGGTEIALACDLVVAAETATFGLPEVKRGLLAAAGGVVRLGRQLPLKLALEVALTGDPIDAATAHAWGLVNRLAPDGEALAVALELAARISSNAPLSVQHTKRMVHATATGISDWDPAWSAEDPWVSSQKATALVFDSEDAREGTQAFAQKRPAVWRGR